MAEEFETNFVERDAIGVVWSSTKGAVALCAHMLVSRGELDLDRRVSDDWPEFAKNGKRDVTVRMHEISVTTSTPRCSGGPPSWRSACPSSCVARLAEALDATLVTIDVRLAAAPGPACDIEVLSS